MSTLTEDVAGIDTVDRLGAAMARSGGALDLYARFVGDGFVAAMSTDELGQVAVGNGATLPEALDDARRLLGAAVREAVRTP